MTKVSECIFTQCNVTVLNGTELPHKKTQNNEQFIQPKFTTATSLNTYKDFAVA